MNMDPNKTLENIRALASKMTKDYEDPESNGIDQDEANELASLVGSLDTWLCKGGFKPEDWNR
jgi:hypothetical protein